MCNHQISSEQKNLARNLLDFIYPWRKLTIGIDGPDGVGKSVFARYLGWDLGIPVIDTDLFLDQAGETLCYRYEDLRRAIMARHGRNRPIIVEGIVLLDILSRIEVECDALVYVYSQEHDGSQQLFDLLERYRQKWKPKEKASYTFECKFIDT